MGKADLFAGRLRELRTAAGLSLKDLAERAGITPDAIVKLESGNRKPGWETVIDLADALGVECTAFLQEPATGQPADGAFGRPRGRPRKKQPEQVAPATQTTGKGMSTTAEKKGRRKAT
jgi:transcriptional regulator with XRE-family HTH domain